MQTYINIEILQEIGRKPILNTVIKKHWFQTALLTNVSGLSKACKTQAQECQVVYAVFKKQSTYMEYGIVDECKVPCDMPFNLRRRWIFSVLFAFSHNLYSCQGKTGKLESRKTIELDDNNQHIHQKTEGTLENLLIFYGIKYQ